MSSGLVFLLGGSDVLSLAGRAFAQVATRREGEIVLLLQGGPRYMDFVPEYAGALAPCQLPLQVIAPNERGVLDVDTACEQLSEAAGIFIGGGHTPTYHSLYCREPVCSVIREQHRRGVPVAGMSAGALILLKHCVFTSKETNDEELIVVDGMGLLQGFVLGVHFSEWNGTSELLRAMEKTKTARGLGVDGTACAVFEGGKFMGQLGGCVYEIQAVHWGFGGYTATQNLSAYVIPSEASCRVAFASLPII